MGLITEKVLKENQCYFVISFSGGISPGKASQFTAFEWFSSTANPSRPCNTNRAGDGFAVL